MNAAAHWDGVYGHPPFSKDIALFVLAVALHAPLLFLRVEAPPREVSKKGSLYTVEVRDSVIQHIMSQPNVLPTPRPVAPPIPKIDLGKFVLGSRAEVLIHSPKIAELPPKLLSPSVSAPVPHPVVGDLPKLEGLEGNVPKVSRVSSKPSDAPLLQSLDSGGIRSLVGGHSELVTVAQPVAPTNVSGPQDTPLLVSRTTVALPPPSVVSEGVPTNIVSGKPVKETIVPPKALEINEPSDSDFMVSAKPRDLTPEQAKRELFPIRGALKDRAVMYQEQPEFPEWARRKGIEATVQLKFFVGPDGRVKENIITVLGSGFTELDDAARSALLRWVFERLPPEKGNVVQEGTIVFKFSIK